MKIFTKSLFLALSTAFILTGCNPDNSENGITSSSSTIVTEDGQVIEKSVGLITFEQNSYTLQTNSEVVKINVRISDVLGGPVNKGFANVIYPTEWTRADVGALSQNRVEVKDGIATFEYQAPKDLNKNIALGYSSSAWKFYYEDDTANAKAVSFNYQPIADQAVTTNYSLEFSSISSNKPVFPIESEHAYTLKLLDIDGNLVNNSDVLSIDVSIDSSIVGILQKDGSEIKSVTTEDNTLSFILKSDVKSGTVPVNVTVSYIDQNKNSRILKKSFTVVVLSGPATAMSINLVETIKSEEHAGFVGRYEIKVTDKYFNEVNTNPGFSAGIIAGYSGFQPASPSSALFTDASKITGTVNNNGTYTVASGLFLEPTVDLANDVFVTFGEGFSYHASGKWEYSIDSANTLRMLDTFTGQSVPSMGFAIGHNYRQFLGTAREAVGTVKSEDGSYIINNSGSAIIDVTYDPYLVGKDVVIWANLIGSNAGVEGHFGEATVVTLPGRGIEATHTWTVPPRSEGCVRFYISLKESNEDYRNGNFDYYHEARGTASISYDRDSTGLNNGNCDRLNRPQNTKGVTNIYDISEEGGRAWVDVHYLNFDTQDFNATDTDITLKIFFDRVSKEFE